MAVLAICRDHSVGRRERLHCADRDRLFADIEMQKAADLFLLIKFGTFLFEAANAHHRPQQRQQVLAAQMRLLCVAVVHDNGSAIKIG